MLEPYDESIYQWRLQELAAIVAKNKPFFEAFIHYLNQEGYAHLFDFVQENSHEKAFNILIGYLGWQSSIELYDGLGNPYSVSDAKWLFLAWVFRDAGMQRLKPLLKQLPGATLVERKAYLLNEIRKFVAPLFPEEGHWEWYAISEVILARLEGSRRALKGTYFEKIIRQQLLVLIVEHQLPVQLSEKQVRLDGETYDIQIIGEFGTLLLPVKTRETMGGGHAQLFTRDIEKAMSNATQNGFRCLPIIVAESWQGKLAGLASENFIYLSANPNQLEKIKLLLTAALEAIALPILREL